MIQTVKNNNMTKYYTAYELAQRLAAIPTVEVRTFGEPVRVDGNYSAEVEIQFPDEFDETAYEQVQNVVEEASHWMLNEREDPTAGPTTARFVLSPDAPTALQEKFDLIDESA